MDDAVTALGDQQAELAGVGAAAADTGLRLMSTSP